MLMKRHWGIKSDAPQTRAESENESADKKAHQADELASKLAYECAWRLCDEALKVLESQRTRAVAKLSVTMLAAGVTASVFLSDDLANDLRLCGVLGLILFIIGTGGVILCTVRVAWPITTEIALSPVKIIKNYIDSQEPNKSPLWV